MMSMDILGLCDGLLGEIGRRQHRFAWLVDSAAGPGEWIPVDAYYPGRRVVVILDHARAQAQLCTELAPRHGLHLLSLIAADLGSDRESAAAALRGMVDALKLPERRTGAPDPPPRGPVRLEDAFARVAASLAYAAGPAQPARPNRPAQAAAAQRAARVAAARGPVTARPVTARPLTTRPVKTRPVTTRPVAARPVRTAPRPRPVPAAAGAGLAMSAIGLGVLLAAIVAGELYVGVARLGLDAGLWGLALGLAVDACARVLGTVAARRADAPHAAWMSAVAGSPGVALFTLFAPEGPIAVDPAPLAGLLSVLATLLTGVALLALLLGI